MADRYSSFAVNEGKSLNTEIGFLANTLIIDNLTSSFIDMRGVCGRFIPPWTYGVTIPLVSGTQVASVLWATPPGVSAATVGKGQANAVYTSAALPASSGQPVVVPTSQTVPLTVELVITPPGGTQKPAVIGAQLLPIGGAGGAAGGTYQMLLPAATETVMVAYGQTGISSGSCTVQIIGVQTNMLYGTVNMVGGGAPQYVSIATGADTEVAVLIGTVTAPNAGDYIEVVAMPFPETVSIVQNTNGIINENVAQVAGKPLNPFGNQLSGQIGVVPTAPGPGAFIQEQLIAANVVSGGTLALIPADPSLRSVAVGRLRLSVATAAGTGPFLTTPSFQMDIPGGTRPVIVCDTHFDYAVLLTGGAQWTLTNQDSVTHTIRGFVTWQWW